MRSDLRKGGAMLPLFYLFTINGGKFMSGVSSEGIDSSVARYLMKPGSRQALKMAREARLLEVAVSQRENDEVSELAREYRSDCLKVFDSALTLESDPEIVKRNLVARVISGVFPVLNSIEEFRSLEDRSFHDMLINSFGILAEIATATQYLESTKLSANAHFERALVDIEERLVEMSSHTEGDREEKIVSIEDFLDELRELKISTREKPFIPFLLWSMIAILSYRQLKSQL